MSSERLSASRWTTAPLAVSGRQLLVGLAILVAALFAAARLSQLLFFVVAAVVTATLAIAAWRWPRATLVAATLATLSDPYVVRGLIPQDDLQFVISGLSEALLAVTGTVIVVRAVRSGGLVAAFRDPVTLFAVLFVIVGVLSAAANGVPPLVAVLGIGVTLDALAVYYAVRMLPFERRSIALGVTAMVAVALAACMVAIAQALLTPQILWFQAFAGRFGEGGRVTGFLGNPNMLAAVIAFSAPFVLFATRHHPDPRWRRAAWAALFVLMLTLLLTFSRGAWVAIILGIAIGTAILDRRALAIMLIVTALAYVSAVALPRNLLVPAGERPPYAREIDTPDIIGSTEDRIEAVFSTKDLRLRFIAEAVPIISDHPILGVGPGRYGGAVARLLPSPVYPEYDAELYGFKTVHNFWLHTLGELGIVGLSLFVAMVIGLAIRFGAAARRVHGIDFVLLAGACTAAIAVGMNNTTEMLFEGNVPGFVIWMLFGFASLLAPAPSLLRRARAPAEASALSADASTTAGR